MSKGGQLRIPCVMTWSHTDQWMTNSLFTTIYLYMETELSYFFLQQDILQKLHKGHQGIVKTQLRARKSVWWPGMSKQIKSFIQNCNTCCKSFSTQTELLIPAELPIWPWQKLGSDLFEYKGATYILVVNCFSCFVEFSSSFQLQYLSQYHSSSEDNFPIMEFQRC